MLYFAKTYPAPPSLAIEKQKINGNHGCQDVLNQLASDFYHKCYLCETKEPVGLNVEHLKPWKGNKDLRFDWANLFFACVHCNNTKLAKYENIIDCTDNNSNVELRIKLSFDDLGLDVVTVLPMDENPETITTANLLFAIFHGDTANKILQSSYLRKHITEELRDFKEKLDQYLFCEIPKIKVSFKNKIITSLSKSTPYTSFKRWIVRDSNDPEIKDFQQYFN